MDCQPLSVSIGGIASCDEWMCCQAVEKQKKTGCGYRTVAQSVRPPSPGLKE